MEISIRFPESSALKFKSLWGPTAFSSGQPKKLLPYLHVGTKNWMLPQQGAPGSPTLPPSVLEPELAAVLDRGVWSPGGMWASMKAVFLRKKAQGPGD